MSENRMDIRKRLERYSRRTGEDAWGSFVHLRERYKVSGRSVNESWLEAVAAYPPDKYPAEISVEVSSEADPREGRSPISPGHGIADSHCVPGSASSALRDPIQIDWDALLGQVDSESSLGSVFDGGGHIDLRRQVEWVIENMTRSGVKSDEAPCAGAWGLLRQCRDDATFRKDIYKVALSKLMPDKKSLESERRFYDDGRVMLDFIERIRQESVDAKYECVGV